MLNLEPKIGLVLTGGGAKGAYQVGALKYLAELNLSPHMIAGTSIGALNGAVLASHKDFSEAVDRLEELWEQLGQAEILRPGTGRMLQVLSYVAQTSVPTFGRWIQDFLTDQGLLQHSATIFDPEPIERFIRAAVNLEGLRHGTKLWVTVFPSLHIPGLNYDLLMALVDLFRARTGTRAQWLRAQDCQEDETLHNLLLASAAIPLAFPRRTVNDRHYVDGGLADNVPLGALAAQGCTHTIVIHLQNGSVWDRYLFPNQTVVEIRPQVSVDRFDTPFVGAVESLLDFSSQRIAELKRRGYEDARCCLQPILQTLVTVVDSRKQLSELRQSTQRLIDDLPLS